MSSAQIRDSDDTQTPDVRGVKNGKNSRPNQNKRFYPIATAYSVSAGLRFLARLAVSTSSLTVTSNASTVSGVKEGSPSSGHTHAQTFWTRTDMPSSLYSNTVCCHTFSVWCCVQMGEGDLDVIGYLLLRRRCLKVGGSH